MTDLHEAADSSLEVEDTVSLMPLEGDSHASTSSKTQVLPTEQQHHVPNPEPTRIIGDDESAIVSPSIASGPTANHSVAAEEICDTFGAQDAEKAGEHEERDD